MAMPATKRMFHISFRQLLSLRKETLVRGRAMEQKCRKLPEMPMLLPPIRSSKGTVRPINGPTTYQGQGCIRASLNIFILLHGQARFSIGVESALQIPHALPPGLAQQAHRHGRSVSAAAIYVHGSGGQLAHASREAVQGYEKRPRNISGLPFRRIPYVQ